MNAIRHDDSVSSIPPIYRPLPRVWLYWYRHPLMAKSITANCGSVSRSHPLKRCNTAPMNRWVDFQYGSSFLHRRVFGGWSGVVHLAMFRVDGYELGFVGGWRMALSFGCRGGLLRAAVHPRWHHCVDCERHGVKIMVMQLQEDWERYKFSCRECRRVYELHDVMMYRR